MKQKIELEVNINCLKCKTVIMKAVTKLEGIDELYVDGEKGILTVIGDVDPVLVATQVRKTGKTAEIISVGPPKVEEAEKPKPKDEKPDSPKCNPYNCRCNACQLVVVSYPAPCDGPSCSIL